MLSKIFAPQTLRHSECACLHGLTARASRQRNNRSVVLRCLLVANHEPPSFGGVTVISVDREKCEQRRVEEVVAPIKRLNVATAVSATQEDVVSCIIDGRCANRFSNTMLFQNVSDTQICVPPTHGALHPKS
eukprot:PhM_4_TR2472/c3_g1_i5/m.70459